MGARRQFFRSGRNDVRVTAPPQAHWQRLPVMQFPATCPFRSLAATCSNASTGCRREIRRDRYAAGFTLVEVLVVLAIIGMLMGLIGPRVLGYLSDSRIKAAGLQIKALSGALDLYYLDNGRYPTSAEGLQALIDKPPAADRWSGPYLKTNGLPRDPWGGAYVYRSPGQHGSFDIVSFGPAGQEGDGGNVTSWQP